MRAAIYQSALAGLSPAERLEKLTAVVESTDADLVLCPELFLSGYAVGDLLRRYAEPAEGPSAEAVSRIARLAQRAIVYGFPEQAGDHVFNAALAFGPDGALLAHHRKLAIPPGFERDHFTPGNGLTPFDLGGLRLGLLICYDAEFPEAVRATAEAGAQAILVPTALGAQWFVVAEHVIPSRAFENGVYVLYANHAGSEGAMTFLGASCIAGPDGRDLVRAGASEIVIAAALDGSAVARAQARLPYFRDLASLRPRFSKG
jgi:predicted amidohydrolase